MRSEGFLAYRGKGGGRSAGRRGGGGRRGGVRGPSRSAPRKGVYRTYSSGRRNGANTRTISNAGAGPANSRTAQAYGPYRRGGFGQVGTGRGSFFISPTKRNIGRSLGGGGGGASASRSVVSGTGGGGSAGGSGPGGGSGDGGGNVPGAAAGPFRVPRERESRARARAEIRGSRALATRRALKIGSSGGASINTGRRGGSGVQV